MHRSHGVGYYVQMTINAPKLKQFGVESISELVSHNYYHPMIRCKFDSRWTRKFYLLFLY
jgi:hypothetical protein